MKAMIFNNKEPEQAADTPEASIDEAEQMRKQIMREMGSRGGKKSKRGKAKPKPEKTDNQDVVSS
jgi:hypothetical protein